MNSTHHAILLSTILRAFSDRPTASVTDWVLEHARFDEPGNRGPFKLFGREYAREILDSTADPRIADEVLVTGSQIGKTSMLFAKVAWILEHEPSRIFWVMPTRDLVRKVSRTRWMPMVQATLAPEMFPTGALRHNFATLEQQIGSSIIDMVWSNSPAALSSTPARVVVLDEVDKFKAATEREADAVDLAEQRTKDSATPKRIKSSTPTTPDAPIWKSLISTDCRRRFMPCPHCGKHVLFAWSKDFTVFPIIGCEAFIRWDTEAKRESGEWDLDRVHNSARHQCPHCQGHIMDGHKTKMDREGEWRPTRTEGVKPNARGWHLPSMYASRPETTCGKLAVKFLTKKRDIEGLHGFINSELAEPWENQESRGERIEVIARGDAPAIGDSPTPLLCADYQFLSPHFWYVARLWAAPGHSRLIKWGHCNDVEDLRKIQIDLGVKDNHVLIDSKHRPEEVYAICLKYGETVKVPGAPPVFRGWLPCAGQDDKSFWKDKKTNLYMPFGMLTHGAPLGHKRFRLNVLGFNGPAVKNMLERLRKGKTTQKWELNESVDDEYFKHLDSNVLKKRFNPFTKRFKEEWVKRHRTWPDHLFDCEVEQIPWAMFHRLLTVDMPQQKQEEKET